LPRNDVALGSQIQSEDRLREEQMPWEGFGCDISIVLNGRLMRAGVIEKSVVKGGLIKKTRLRGRCRPITERPKKS